MRLVTRSDFDGLVTENNKDAINYFTINDKTICFMFDIEITDDLDLSYIDNSDLLIFDGMYDDNEYNAHVGWGHSTYQTGCHLAATCGCKELLITHHNPKNNDEKLLELEDKAKLIFKKIQTEI